MQAVAALSGLRDLCWYGLFTVDDGSPLSSLALLPLTGLCQLTRFEFVWGNQPYLFEVQVRHMARQAATLCVAYV